MSLRGSFSGVVVLISALVLASAGLGGASAERRITSMFLGTQNVGAIEFSQDGTWSLDCDNYSGGYITRGPRHRERINVHYMDGMVGGYSRLQPNGRFLIYAAASGRVLAGTAIRRTASRWDIMRRHRRVGHTVGRDGAEAATALVTIC